MKYFTDQFKLCFWQHNWHPYRHFATCG